MTLDRSAIALLIVCAAAAGCVQKEPGSPAAGPSPLPSSVAALLVAQAPPIRKSSFGPGADVNIVRPSVLFSEARIIDETLYVMYYPLQSQNQRIATLARGVLHPLRFPHEYTALSFRNDNRVILAGGSGEPKDWYELRGGRALPIPAPANPVYGIPLHVLADGDSCADGLAGSGSALDDLRAHRRVGILTDAAMLRATHGALAQAVGVWCDHFHGENYATMDVPGVIFRLDRHGATLVAPGWIEASSERHLLIVSNSELIDVDAR